MQKINVLKEHCNHRDHGVNQLLYDLEDIQIKVDSTLKC